MPFRCNKERSAPKIDSWRTSQETFAGSENFLSMLNIKVFSYKYENHEIAFSKNPIQLIRLIKIEPVSFPDSKSLFIMLVNIIISYCYVS